MNIQAPNPLGLKPLIPFHSYRNDLFFPQFWKHLEMAGDNADT